VCGFFDEDAAHRHRPVDVVMMNGVLHHLGDAEADGTLRVIKEVLRPGGKLFTLDGCFVEGQPALARLLLQYDRGQFVRTQEAYRALLTKHFGSVEVHIDKHLSWMPYTWITIVAHD
jgi:hypothetical protein